MPLYNYRTNPEKYDPIEQEIVDALPSFNTLAVQKGYETPDWTNGIKATFGAIGFNKGYKIYSTIRERIPFDQIRQDVQQMLNGSYVPMKQQNGRRNDRRYLLGEWLYDILWWHENNQGYAIDVPLVAESEWGNEGAIHDDFQRLLLARSKYKIMIFDISRCGNNIIQWFIDQIQRLYKNNMTKKIPNSFLNLPLPFLPRKRFFYKVVVTSTDPKQHKPCWH